MTQKTISQVVDAFSAAIGRVADHAPADVVAELHQATGDLIEVFGSAATNLAAHEVAEVHRLIAALDKRTERRHEDSPHVDERRVGD